MNLLIRIKKNIIETWKTIKDCFDPSQEHAKEWAKYIFFINELLFIGVILANMGPLLDHLGFFKGTDKYTIIVKHFLTFIVIPIIIYGLVKGLDKIRKGLDSYLTGILFFFIIVGILVFTYSESLYIILFEKT